MQSWVENLDLGSTICCHLCQLMSPWFKTFMRVSLLHGHLDSSLQVGYKMSIRPWQEQLNNSAMFLFHLPPRVLLTPPDPLWSILLLWRSWVVRRILMHRVIVSLILAPCRARGSATVVRRILVISPESSLHARRAVLVFARAKMCGHLPLVCSIKCSSGKPHASFPQFPSHWEISWASVRHAAFPLLRHNFINGPMWLILW